MAWNYKPTVTPLIRGCVGKVKLEQWVVDKVEACMKKARGGKEVRHYKCDLCGYYHTTTSKAKWERELDAQPKPPPPPPEKAGNCPHCAKTKFRSAIALAQHIRDAHP